MSGLPKSIWTGTLIVFGVELVCHVLDNGQRIIETEGVQRLFGDDVPAFDLNDTGAEDLARFIKTAWRPPARPTSEGK